MPVGAAACRARRRLSCRIKKLSRTRLQLSWTALGNFVGGEASEVKDMTDTKSEIGEVLRTLQAAATLCANTFTTSHLKVEYRVAFSAGAPLPWRLLEIHFRLPRNDKRYALRRMHCFGTPERLRQSIHERARWRACDQELVASYLVKAQGTSGEATDSEPNPRRSGAARPSLELRELRPARLELRAQICTTRPEMVVDLLNGRVAHG